MYDLYMKSLRSRPVTTLRDLLDFGGLGRREAVPIEEVEPAEAIMRRSGYKPPLLVTRAGANPPPTRDQCSHRFRGRHGRQTPPCPSYHA